MSLDLKKLYKKVENTINEPFSISRNGELCINLNGKKEELLSNCIVVPTKLIEVIDGVSSVMKVELTAIITDKITMKSVVINMEDLKTSRWIDLYFGLDLMLYPISRAYESLKLFIKSLNKIADKVTEFQMIGWHKIDKDWVYLHSGGVLSGDKKKYKNIYSNLSDYNIEINNSKRKDAYDEVMKLLDIAPREITLPLLCYTLLSFVNTPLKSINCEPNFILWLHGETGSRKTTIALLFSSLFNKSNSKVPASFKDTKAAIESKAFEYKDSVLIIDDYHPSSNRMEKIDMESKAQFLIRSIGDRIGKARMNRDMSMQDIRLPRGLAVVTGEDFIDGHSSIARCISIPINRDDIKLKKLTNSQKNCIDIS